MLSNTWMRDHIDEALEGYTSGEWSYGYFHYVLDDLMGDGFVEAEVY